MRGVASGSLVVTPVRAFRDNYVWVLGRDGQAVVVDPGDAVPVEAALTRLGLTLRAILLTHHHADHVGGVPALLAARSGSTLPVYGPANEAIAGLTHRVGEGDRFSIDAVGLAFDVLDIPGHTRGHVAFVSVEPAEAPLLFCGDTLFAAGCGRLFEGTPDQMLASLEKLAALPAKTRVYCGHEYTVANLRFATTVEPDSEALERRVAEADATRTRDEPTLPSSIALERATNPFLRVAESSVRAAADRHERGAGDSPLATFTALRRWKDAF